MKADGSDAFSVEMRRLVRALHAGASPATVTAARELLNQLAAAECAARGLTLTTPPEVDELLPSELLAVIDDARDAGIDLERWSVATAAARLARGAQD